MNIGYLHWYGSSTGYRYQIIRGALRAVSCQVLRNLDTLFNEISKSNVSVDTFPYIQKLNIPQYQTGSQYDVHECLAYLLEKSYPTKEHEADSIFRIEYVVTMECECGKDYNNEVQELMLKLDTENFFNCF